MAVRTSREIVIEAPPEAIMDALADVEPDYFMKRAGKPVIDAATDELRNRVLGKTFDQPD